MATADSVHFAAAARLLAAEARERGLAVPGFRSPPRLVGADRSLRRRADGSAVVAVRLRGRPIEAVVADMVDGLLAANDLVAGDAARHRGSMVTAVLDRGARPAA
ncbi:MAG: hypothetical protein QOJ69_1762 [Actinomycetota bacterium]|nr:hypothetical protein [Actinomycetota bacterium]